MNYVSLFAPGDRVRFVPKHCKRDITHKDCKDGIVSRVNDKFVFVRYYQIDNQRGTSVLSTLGKATSPDDLVFR